jgi:1-acyl-sn-glycerol-3-phosphate acyltransferase
VGLVGTEQIQPVGKTLPRLAEVVVRFGEPMFFTGAFEGEPLGRARREVTDAVMAAIHRLSGQELAGIYNERPIE